jgi:hypothetical protein
MYGSNRRIPVIGANARYRRLDQEHSGPTDRIEAWRRFHGGNPSLAASIIIIRRFRAHGCANAT